jgi:hypothetical protein
VGAGTEILYSLSSSYPSDNSVLIDAGCICVFWTALNLKEFFLSLYRTAENREHAGFQKKPEAREG